MDFSHANLCVEPFFIVSWDKEFSPSSPLLWSYSHRWINLLHSTGLFHIKSRYLGSISALARPDKFFRKTFKGMEFSFHFANFFLI